MDNDNYILADDKLRRALDSIVIELNGHGIGNDDLRYVQWHCDDDLRQQYGDEQLLEFAHRRFYSYSPVLSEQATQWFRELNAKYFDGQLTFDCAPVGEPFEHFEYLVFVRYGHEMGQPLIEHRYDSVYVYGAWEDDVIVDLLLCEMAKIETEVERNQILQREYVRLENLGARLRRTSGMRERRSWDGLDGPRVQNASQPDVQPHPVWDEIASLWQADRKFAKSRVADVSFAKDRAAIFV